MSANVLVVEDEPSIQKLIIMNLENVGFRVRGASDAETARLILTELDVDLVIIDWALPGESGIALLRSLRRDAVTINLPIIMLTARTFVQDKVYALECGADDYMTKPFSPRELIARIRSVLRRDLQHPREKEIELNGLRIDPEKQKVLAGERPLHLSATEFRLLYLLMSNPQRVYSRALLLDKVWGLNKLIDVRTVDSYIARLRDMLEPVHMENSIETVRGIGYRFITKRESSSIS